MIIIRLIHTVVVLFVAFLSTMLHSTLSLIFGYLIGPYSTLSNENIRIWAKTILGISGARVEVEGLENIKNDNAYIFISNHLSAYDIVSTIAFIPGAARFIAKKELFKIPLFAQGMKSAGMIPIDRGNSAEARKSLDDAIKTIKEGCSVIIFAEGTRSKNGEIQNFKKGGFVLAINGEIPIIPTVICGSQYIRPGKFIHPGKIKIKFLEAVSTTGITLEKRDQLIKDVRNIIIRNYEIDYNKKEV